MITQTALEQYYTALNWLRNYRHFDTQDEGLASLADDLVAMAAHEENNWHAYFVVDTLNGFEIHRGYEQRGEFVSQIDFTITRIQLNELRDRTIRELGEIQLEELGISH